MNKQLHLYKNKVVLLALLLLLLLNVIYQQGNAMAWSVYGNDVGKKILQRINQVRINPWSEAERLGLDIDALKQTMSADAIAMWDEGLPMVAWSEELAMAARKHVEDMLTRLYYSHISPEGIGVEERVRNENYKPIFIGESLIAVAFEDVISEDEAADLLLDSLFVDAFSGGKEGEPLLSPYFLDAGLAMTGGQLKIAEKTVNVFLLLIDMARTMERSHSDSALVFGHIYIDVNANNIYDIGEGIEGVKLTLRGTSDLVFSPASLVIKQIESGAGGTYFFEVYPGHYVLEGKGAGMVDNSVFNLLLEDSTEVEMNLQFEPPELSRNEGEM